MREIVFGIRCPNPDCESHRKQLAEIAQGKPEHLDIKSVDIGVPDKAGNQHVLWICSHCGNMIPVTTVRSGR